jgi:hypothetical protein
MGASYAANTTGKTYSFPAVAVDASIDAHCHRSEQLDSALVATLRGFLHSGWGKM